MVKPLSHNWCPGGATAEASIAVEAVPLPHRGRLCKISRPNVRKFIRCLFRSGMRGVVAEAVPAAINPNGVAALTQGCRRQSTLGSNRRDTFSTPTGLRPTSHAGAGRNPVGVVKKQDLLPFGPRVGRWRGQHWARAATPLGLKQGAAASDCGTKNRPNRRFQFDLKRSQISQPTTGTGRHGHDLHGLRCAPPAAIHRGPSRPVQEAMPFGPPTFTRWQTPPAGVTCRKL